MRQFLAVLAGVITGFVVISLMEAIGHIIYPVPMGLDFSDPEILRRWLEFLPMGAKLFVLLGWALGVFGATSVTSLIQKELIWWPSLLVIVLLLISSLLNLFMIPHPIWFWPATVIVHLLFGCLGHWLVRRRKKRHTLLSNNSSPHA